MASSSQHLAVASIDFGTTYSGWAFSLYAEYKKDKSKVYARNWSSGDHISPKTPTTLLINPDGKTLRAFGYDAENIYTDMETEEERQSHFFFQRFKMILYKQNDISRKMMLEAANGKSISAILVFQLAIQYLKNHLLEECGNTLIGGLGVRDIHWCLTVPAIWNDKAKKFMREAAIMAGINSFDLTLVLEPEAASVFCRNLPVEKLEGGSVAAMKPGSTYMVVDCGGGTTDICCHRILENKKLAEIHRANGGAVGGTDVDGAFESLLVEIFGRAEWDEFSRENKGDVLALFRNLEVKKRDITLTEGELVTFSLPRELGTLLGHQDAGRSLSNAGLKDVIKFLKDKNKLRFNHTFLRHKIFHNVVERLRDLLLDVCSNPRVEEIKLVLLVGGMSNSPVIRDAVRKALPDKQVITTQEPSLAVVKGAVIYGHDVSVVQSRIARYTYGEEIDIAFDPAVHDENMSFIDSHGTKQVPLFQTLITAGQELPSDHGIMGKSGIPVYEDETEIGLYIYAVDPDDEIPVYTEDPSCIYLGNVLVPIKNRSIPLDERHFSPDFKFGGTEIYVSITEISTGNTTEGTVDFLG